MVEHIIEGVCTGNSGRSTQFEVIGNFFANELNLENELSFISSGTGAGPENDHDLPYNKVVSVLGHASKYGLIKPVQVDEQKYNDDADYRSVIQYKVHIAFGIMRPIEAALRDKALFDMGLKYDGTRTQTVPRSDVSVVLGMTSKHADQIRRIYLPFEQKPVISTVTEYAGVSGEIPDALGNPDPKAYFLIRDRLVDLVPRVIERFGNEFLQ